MRLVIALARATIAFALARATIAFAHARATIAFALARATIAFALPRAIALSLSLSLALAMIEPAYGEPFHVYDRSRWLRHPAASASAIYFDDHRFSTDPVHDRSIHIVTPARETTTAAALDGLRSGLRKHGLLLPSLPVSGTWYVAQAADGYHVREDGYGEFALDLVRLVGGSDHRGNGAGNEDYYSFDQPVVSPVDGVVWAVDRSQPDGDPRRWAYGAGNAVYIRLAGRYELA